MTPAVRAELQLSSADPSGIAAAEPRGAAPPKRIDSILLLGASLALGGTATTHPKSLVIALVLLLLITWPFTARPLKLLIIAAALIGALRAQAVVDAHQRAWLSARQQVVPGARCAGEGEVVASPTLRGDRLGVRCALRLECDGERLTAGRPSDGVYQVRLYGGPLSLARGDKIRVATQLSPVQVLRNLELPDPRPGAARGQVSLSGSVLTLELLQPGHGIGHAVDGARAQARERIQATFDPLAAPMARALVLGENDLDAEDDAAFRKSGLSHLLAVSGTHLVFAVVSLVTALQALLVRIPFISARYQVARIAALLGCPLALVYADYAGGSGSAWRAAFMLCAVFAARALGRRAGPARSLGWSLLAGSLLDPLVSYDVSFLLSAAATVGLVCIGSPALAWAERQAFAQRSKLLSYLAASILATVGSMLPCAPLLAVLSPDLTLAGIAANVVAAPLGEIIALPLCLGHLLMSPLPALESGVAKAAGGALLVVRQVAHWSAEARSLAFAVPPPTAVHLLALGAGGGATLIAAWQKQQRRTLALALATLLGASAAELWARHACRPTGQLRVAQLDVGQGDAALVDLPDGRLMLIDGGGSASGGSAGGGFDPGRRVILPLLRARRRSSIDVVLITHPHPDHYAGLITVLDEIPVAEIWQSGFPGGKQYEQLLGKAPKVRSAAELCGEPEQHAEFTLEVLAPCPTSPELGANDNSIVLRLQVGARVLLFTGDAEAAEEAQLLEQHAGQLKADWLKAGHHGSHTSSGSELLRAVSPALIGVSCGVRNQFGHPHPAALRRMHDAGAAVWRIDNLGSLELNLIDGALSYTGFAWGGASRPLEGLTAGATLGS